MRRAMVVAVSSIIAFMLGYRGAVCLAQKFTRIPDDEEHRHENEQPHEPSRLTGTHRPGAYRAALPLSRNRATLSHSPSTHHAGLRLDEWIDG